jgi:hypothetical protein
VPPIFTAIPQGALKEAAEPSCEPGVRVVVADTTFPPTETVRMTLLPVSQIRKFMELAANAIPCGSLNRASLAYPSAYAADAMVRVVSGIPSDNEGEPMPEKELNSGLIDGVVSMNPASVLIQPVHNKTHFMIESTGIISHLPELSRRTSLLPASVRYSQSPVITNEPNLLKQAEVPFPSANPTAPHPASVRIAYAYVYFGTEIAATDVVGAAVGTAVGATAGDVEGDVVGAILSAEVTKLMRMRTPIASDCQ